MFIFVSLLIFTFIVTPLYGVSMPEALSVAEVLDSACLLVWEPLPSSETDEYIIYTNKNRNLKFNEFTRTKKNEFKVTGLENGKKVYFTISTIKNGEKSEMSNIVSVIPEDLTPPMPPVALRSYSGKRFVKLTWKPSKEKDFLHYTIYRRTINSKKMRLLEEDTGIIQNKFIDNNLRSGILYIYGVTATDRTGNESEISKTIEGHTKFVPNITFKYDTFKKKLNGYCYNPNDRSVYQCNSHSDDIKKWSMWRRTIFHFPNQQSVLHEVIFPLTLYGVVFILWLFWIQKFSKYAS
jgi:fibronectin type 3 domain-containing protein